MAAIRYGSQMTAKALANRRSCEGGQVGPDLMIYHLGTATWKITWYDFTFIGDRQKTRTRLATEAATPFPQAEFPLLGT